MLKSNKLIKSFVLAVAISAVLARAAFASGGTGVSAYVIAGPMSITNPLVANFPGRTITGVAQTTMAALEAFSISDLRGIGVGWHITAQATRFNGGGHNLAVGSLAMSRPTVAAANGTTSPLPTITAGSFYTIDNGAFRIASAALFEGMGVYDFSATTLTLSLPASVYAGTYASTVTISVVDAP